MENGGTDMTNAPDNLTIRQAGLRALARYNRDVSRRTVTLPKTEYHDASARKTPASAESRVQS